MKDELLIDYTDDLLLKFKVDEEINVQSIILDIFGEKKSFEVSKENEYYTFNVPNSIFKSGKTGIISFFFSFINKKGQTELTNFAKFKRFQMLSGPVKKIEDNYVIPNQTKNRNFILVVSKNLKDYRLNIDNDLASIKYQGQKVILGGKLMTYLLPVKKLEMGLEGREFSKFIFPVNYKKIDKYQDTFDLTSELVIDSKVKDDVYDFFMYIHIDGFPEPVKIRFGKTRFIKRRGMKDHVLEYDKETLFISPYLTFSGTNMSLRIERIDNTILESIENIKTDKSKEIWVIGERPYKAQDTGKAFFEYVRNNHPEKEAYYIIDFDSAEYENVKHLGNVINFKTKEHFEICLKATHFFGSHHIDYLYPIRNKEFISKIKAKKIFLQHGVLGVKNLNKIYLNQKEQFDTDIFIVSTEREKQIVMEDLEFPEEQVKLTGLSRFDSLFANDLEMKKQVLIIPTWRDWLQNIDLFLESEYFKKYQNLISNKTFLDHCQKNGMDIVFYLHPNMQQYSSFFTSPDVKMVLQGEIDVQKLIKESMVMITDYSSVAFDFAFLDKPVIYYQFDQERFLGKEGSHLDLERELPGDIVSNEEDLIKKFQDITYNNFQISPENQKRVNKLLKYKDAKNSERIYNAAENYKVKFSISQKIRSAEEYRKGYNFFRRSKFYFPTMKLLYKIFKILPLKERYVFESGVGVQYSDSPRVLYEELLKIKPDAECIWSYDKTSFIHPLTTKVVKRLSPEYYYYLATSKYWINNQNFPTYLSKRKKTTYLQTWHGTPLKKMLFDLKEIYGREKGYVKRVEKAKNQWSYLISQNSYATKHFRTAFRYDGPILEEGYPRNDILVNNPETGLIINKIRNMYSIPSSKKIILYAPTFRDTKKVENKFESDIKIDFTEFNKRFGEEYVLLMRMHVTMNSNIEIPEEYKKSVINVSTYPDIQDLFLMTDILITDYSSVMFDYAVLERPMLFYAYDLEEYQNDIRGSYLDYEEEVPGVIVKTQKDLFESIDNIQTIEIKYKSKLSNFKQKYAPRDDGNAAKRIVEKVLLD